MLKEIKNVSFFEPIRLDLVLSDKEIENKNEISVRSRGGVTETMVLSKFLFKLMVESSKF